MIGLSVASELIGRVRLGALTLRDLDVAQAQAELALEAERLADELRRRFAGLRSGDVPGVEEARGLYRALGLDPTKTRPSNEALLRRVLKGDALHRVNTLVDALNLCSLREQLPFGLYDLAQLRPPVVLRRGATGEAYAGIRKESVNVAGRPVLVDAVGPFGNPTSDSARTSVSTATRDALVVLFAPAAFGRARIDAVLDATSASLTASCGGHEDWRAVLPG